MHQSVTILNLPNNCKKICKIILVRLFTTFQWIWLWTQTLKLDKLTNRLTKKPKKALNYVNSRRPNGNQQYRGPMHTDRQRVKQRLVLGTTRWVRFKKFPINWLVYRKNHNQDTIDLIKTLNWMKGIIHLFFWLIVRLSVLG